MDILEQMKSNLDDCIFQDGIKAGTATLAKMLRLLPLEQWPRALEVVERDLANGTAFNRVKRVIESDAVIDAEIIE